MATTRPVIPSGAGMGPLGTPIQRLIRRFHPARFFRGIEPPTESVTLNRSRVFILPTRYGIAFAFLLGVMLIGSVNYNNSLGFGLTFLLASVAVISMLHTYHNLAGLTLRPGRAEPVFAGSVARFPILVANPKGPQRFALRFTTEDPNAEAVAVDLPRGTSVIELERAAAVRGRLKCGRFTIETRFPLSLFRSWSPIHLSLECLVYPRPGPPRPWRAEASAPHTGGRKGDGGEEDFIGLRAYRHGDPPRQVHWRVSARGETLLVKQFGGGAPRELWLDWDQLPGLDVEKRLGQLCRWVLDAHDNSCAWGLRIPGTQIAAAQGAAHLRRCLTTLALFDS